MKFKISNIYLGNFPDPIGKQLLRRKGRSVCGVIRGGHTGHTALPASSRPVKVKN